VILELSEISQLRGQLFGPVGVSGRLTRVGDLAAILASDAARRELAELGTVDQPMALSDPGLPDVVVRTGGDGLGFWFGRRADLRAIKHPVTTVLPRLPTEWSEVDTERWPTASVAYLADDLVLPDGPFQRRDTSNHSAALDYLGRVIVVSRSAGPNAARFVEPGVGRSYLIDFLRLSATPEFVDFSATGVGCTPFSRQGFLLATPPDGCMPLVRAWHRTQMADRLAAASVRVPRTASIIELPGRHHVMANGTVLPAAMLVRGFRCVLRVKQLDPMANPLLNHTWWSRYHAHLGAEGQKARCSCFVPSVLLGTWPGRRCATGVTCHDQRVSAILESGAAVLRLVAARLRARSNQPMSLATFGEWFAATLGKQLAILRSVRVLHDYRILRGPWSDPHSVIDSLGDTNVSLAAELVDLDTAIAVDDPQSVLEEALGVTPAEVRTLRGRFDELHAIERRLACGVAQTVGYVATGGGRIEVARTAQIFEQAYREACK